MPEGLSSVAAAPVFPPCSVESAPAAARRAMTAVAEHQGYLPDAVARLASSPQALDGFLTASGLFEAATLDPLAREVVVLTMATRNRCHICVAMHTARLAGFGADAELTAALRAGVPLADPRLEAVRRFTLDVIATSGAVSGESMATFLGRGFTARNALEVVLGIGAYTISTLGNRMTGAVVDRQLQEYAWDEPAGEDPAVRPDGYSSSSSGA